MKVLYVIGTMERGGAETQLLLLMKHIQKKGVNCSLFTFSDGSMKDEFLSLDINCRIGECSFYVSKLVKMFKMIFLFFNLLIFIKRESPIAIHSFLPLSNFFAIVAGRFLRVPIVITSRRALNTHQDRVKGWRWVDRLTARWSDAVVANSYAVRQDTLAREGGDPAKIHVIHNAIVWRDFAISNEDKQRLRDALGLKSEMFVILNVANLIPYKGHKDLLESFALVKKEIPHAVLLIAGGDRGIGSMLRNKARDLEVDDSVRWLGLRDDVPQLLSLADVFVCSSHEEGFSNAVMEAMAAGVAVVATDVGGNREMLENGRLGVLVPARSPEAMAQAIVRLARDPRLREDLGRNAAATVQEKYTPEAMTDAYLRLYRSLL